MTPTLAERVEFYHRMREDVATIRLELSILRHGRIDREWQDWRWLAYWRDRPCHKRGHATREAAEKCLYRLARADRKAVAAA